MARLDDRQVQAAMAHLKDWSHVDNAIRRQFSFPSFPDAMAFATRLAFDAEAADHHPDIHVSYKKVTLTYSTHSEGGLTQKDIDGARNADDIAARLLKS